MKDNETFGALARSASSEQNLIDALAWYDERKPADPRQHFTHLRATAARHCLTVSTMRRALQLRRELIEEFRD